MPSASTRTRSRCGAHTSNSATVRSCPVPRGPACPPRRPDRPISWPRTPAGAALGEHPPQRRLGGGDVHGRRRPGQRRVPGGDGVQDRGVLVQGPAHDVGVDQSPDPGPQRPAGDPGQQRGHRGVAGRRRDDVVERGVVPDELLAGPPACRISSSWAAQRGQPVRRRCAARRARWPPAPAPGAPRAAPGSSRPASGRRPSPMPSSSSSGRRLVTNVPSPRRTSSTRAVTSARTASRVVLREDPTSAASSCSGGSRLPAVSFPSMINWRILAIARSVIGAAICHSQRSRRPTSGDRASLSNVFVDTLRNDPNASGGLSHHGDRTELAMSRSGNI